MHNLTYLIGRLTKDVEVMETEEGKKYSTINVGVSRSYKNTEGIYETDFINVKLWNGIATNVSEYCKKGDLIGIKGRIETFEKDGQYKTEIVADKISFLSSKSKEINEEIEKEK